MVMEKPLTKPPVPGIMTDVIGVLTNYTPNPFMFTMEKGELPVTKPTGKGKKVIKGAKKELLIYDPKISDTEMLHIWLRLFTMQSP